MNDPKKAWPIPKATVIAFALALPIIAVLCLYSWYRQLVPIYMRDIGMSEIEQELFNRVCIGTAIAITVTEFLIFKRLAGQAHSISDEEEAG